MANVYDPNNKGSSAAAKAIANFFGPGKKKKEEDEDLEVADTDPMAPNETMAQKIARGLKKQRGQ